MEANNKFFVESEFVDHYERAIQVARYRGNWIRSYEGHDLLGVPALDDEGVPVRQEGRVVWRHLPVSGFVPSTVPGVEWVRAPWLAHELQSTLIRTDANGNMVTALRLTPEVRLVAPTHAVRTLTIEWSFASDTLRIDRDTIDALLVEAGPLILRTFPLHETVDRSWRAIPPIKGFRVTALAHLVGTHYHVTEEA